MTVDISGMAKRIDAAAHEAQAMSQFSGECNFTIAQAYKIQAASIERRARRGEVPCGAKLGFTSRAKIMQMGVDDMVIGQLTDAMQIPEGGQLDLANFIHPRVEPEIVFRLQKSIAKIINLIDAMDAIDSVAPALEIIDSRYNDFKFSLVDVLADNCSSSAFVIGDWQSPHTDVSNLGISLHCNGRPVSVGSTAAILGHPLRALVEAARLSSEVGISLNAGDIVLAGAATAAIELKPGVSIHAEFQHVGQLGFTVKEIGT